MKTPPHTTGDSLTPTSRGPCPLKIWLPVGWGNHLQASGLTAVSTITGDCLSLPGGAPSPPPRHRLTAQVMASDTLSGAQLAKKRLMGKQPFSRKAVKGNIDIKSQQEGNRRVSVSCSAARGPSVLRLRAREYRRQSMGDTCCGTVPALGSADFHQRRQCQQTYSSSPLVRSSM